MTAPDEQAMFGIYGDNTQNAVGNYVNRDLIQRSYTFVRGRPSLFLGPSEIDDILRCHVPAGNHELIVKVLQTDHAVIIAGPAESGRKTTAIAAIRRLRPHASIRHFSLEDDDAEEIHVRSDGFLIDASAGAGNARLSACVDAVRASHGYLVVIADGAFPDPPVGVQVISIEPPPTLQVYRRRAVARGLIEWRDWDQAPALLENARPGDARRLSNLIEQLGARDDDLAAQQAEVARAYRRWDEELRGWFAGHREPHERALLIAATALSPYADQTLVYSTASDLARRLQITMNGTGLAWRPVSGLTALLDAEREQERVVFHRLDFADSALRHTLADYPLARSDLLSWLAALPTETAVPDEARNALAGTFADMAAAYGTAEIITDTAYRWAAADRADLAFVALYRTCLDPRVGARVRRALYDWSRKSRLPQTLKLVIARVCQPLGQTYPSIALTRLKHLATHRGSADRQVLGEVLAAAHALAADGNHAEVLASALNWSAQTNRERLSGSARRCRRYAGAALFLDLAEPVAESGLPQILDDPQAVEPTRCEPAWRAALDAVVASRITEEAFEGVAHRWLDAALHHQRVRARLIRSFVDAASPSTLPTAVAYGNPQATHVPTPAMIMIEVVRRWAAVDRKDPARRQIKEAIVIPLTQPWWLRLLKILYIHLRTLIVMAQRK